jgi:hypothetical protein
MVLARARSKFYKIYKAILLGDRRKIFLAHKEDSSIPDRTSIPNRELLDRKRWTIADAEACVKTVDFWWRNSLVAFFGYVFLTFFLTYIQMWLA